MGLEVTFNYIDDLNNAWPNNDPDQVKEAANHLRGIKNAVQGSFPNLGNASVTLTAAQMNALTSQTVPIGGIIMYNGTFSSIPANWQLCDGTNGTPDMADNFVYGTIVEGQLHDTGGTADTRTLAHTHADTFSVASNGAHTHTVGSNSGISGFVSTHVLRSDRTDATTTTTSSNGSHVHTLNGSVSSTGTGTGIDENIPPYIKLAYIRRMS